MALSASQVGYKMPRPHVAVIKMDRPDVRNAQGLQMTYELDAAFRRAALDDEVKVIVLRGEGPHFSSGHDLRGDDGKAPRDFPLAGSWAGFDAGGAEGRYGREREIYLDMAERWRNIPKPTIAAVQGKCIAGGLILAWCCDMILAADDAIFQDPTINFGICGVEFFMHVYEVGIRAAKEWMFTTDQMNAEDALRLGMVNRIIPAAKLEEEALDLATRIAAKPSFALKTAKEACNRAQDLLGRRETVTHAFALHQLCHAHNELKFGLPADPEGMPPTVRDKYRALIADRKSREISG